MNVPKKSPVQAASAAAMAGTVRLISAPAATPSAKASSVHAAKSTPRRSNSCGASPPSRPWANHGWKYQENSRLNASAATVTATASSASLVIAQRVRPHPWVQANRNVPVSSSRASTGPPTNTPTSTGTTCKKPVMVCAVG